MDGLIEIPREDTATVVLSSTDANGVAVNMNAFDNVVVVVTDKDRTVVGKYSIVTSDGWDELVIGDLNNQVKFILQSDQTKKTILSRLWFEMRAIKADDTQRSEVYNTIVKRKEFAVIVDSDTSKLEMPELP